MKWLLVVIVACLVAQCEEKNLKEDNDIDINMKMNWEGFMLCLNHIKPIAMDIKELYAFVVNKDYANAVMKVVDIVQKGGEAAKVCYNAYKDM